jgi:hypothetical protein
VIRQEKIYQVNVPQNQAGVDKVDFKPKLVRRDKEGHLILIKEQYLYIKRK